MEGAIFKSLQRVGCDCPPIILLITSIFSANVIDLHGLLATFSLAAALPLLGLGMAALLFFILKHELIKNFKAQY
jgi:hypothetical protein